MKRWYNRKPETMQDWRCCLRWLPRCWLRCGICPPLRLRCGCCWGWQRPLRAVWRWPMCWDIPARWFAIHLFGGRRGPGILLAYLALFGTVAALVGLVVPQLVQSVGSFAAALPGYLENAQALLELVQANYGVDTTSLSELLLNSGSSVESFLSWPGPAVGPGGPWGRRGRW